MPDFVLGGGIEVVIDPQVPTEVIVVPIQGAGGPGGGAVSSVNTQTGAVVLDQDDIADGATAKQYTATDKAKLAAITGTNTGDQDLSGLVPNTRTINGEPLSANVVLDAADVGAATTAQGGKADSAVQPGDLSTVATSGAYGDLTGKPTLGTAAATAASDYATAAQGTKADNAATAANLTTETSRATTAEGLLAPKASPAFTGTPTGITKTHVGLGNVDNTSDVDKPISDDTQDALDAKADLVGGTVPSSQLPSYVDDVLPFANLAAFPGTGETSKIYVAEDTNLTYRWTGSAYAVLDPSLALGETSGTAYRGDRGKTAYDHSQVTTGNPHGVTQGDVGLGNVTNDAQLPLAGGTLTNGANIVLGTATGTKIGTATTQKLGFLNATPIVQQGATVDLATLLASFGLRASGTAWTQTSSGAAQLTGAFRRNVAIISASGTTTMTVAASLPFQQCNATTGAQTINLPSTNLPGYAYLLWKEDVGANTVTVQVASSGTINGASTVVLANQYDYVQVVSTATTGVYRLINTNLATIGPVATALALKAPLASPAFTGNPTAPTPSPGDNDTSVATTAFVAAADAVVTDKLRSTFGDKFQPLDARLADPAIFAGSGVTHTTTPPTFTAYQYLRWDVLPPAITRYGALSEITIGTPANGGALYLAGDRTPQPATFEFVYEGSHFSFLLDSYGSEYHLYVNDQPITVDPVSMGSGGSIYLDVPFTDRGAYKIKLTIGVGSVIQGFFYEQFDSFYPVGRKLRLGVMGDSYSYPANDTTVGYQYWLAALTGFDVYPLGEGGTGYNNTGVGGVNSKTFGDPVRVALANTYDLDAMLIVGSINDSDVGLQPIAAAAYAAFAAARPDMPLIVAGPEPYDVFATPVATNNAVKAAALAAPNVLHYIDWYVDDWINGSGNTGAPAGDGNADWIIGVDGVHPNLAGFRYLGLMFAEALRGLPTTL